LYEKQTEIKTDTVLEYLRYNVKVDILNIKFKKKYIVGKNESKIGSLGSLRTTFATAQYTTAPFYPAAARVPTECVDFPVNFPDNF